MRFEELHDSTFQLAASISKANKGVIPVYISTNVCLISRFVLHLQRSFPGCGTIRTFRRSCGGFSPSKRSTWAIMPSVWGWGIHRSSSCGTTRDPRRMRSRRGDPAATRRSSSRGEAEVVVVEEVVAAGELAGAESPVDEGKWWIYSLGVYCDGWGCIQTTKRRLTYSWLNFYNVLGVKQIFKTFARLYDGLWLLHD